jgi:hypothetical protein
MKVMTVRESVVFNSTSYLPLKLLPHVLVTFSFEKHCINWYIREIIVHDYVQLATECSQSPNFLSQTTVIVADCRVQMFFHPLSCFHSLNSECRDDPEKPGENLGVGKTSTR